jgi:hypothetical protein
MKIETTDNVIFFVFSLNFQLAICSLKDDNKQQPGSSPRDRSLRRSQSARADIWHAAHATFRISLHYTRLIPFSATPERFGRSLQYYEPPAGRTLGRFTRVGGFLTSTDEELFLSRCSTVIRKSGNAVFLRLASYFVWYSRLHNLNMSCQARFSAFISSY